MKNKVIIILIVCCLLSSMMAFADTSTTDSHGQPFGVITTTTSQTGVGITSKNATILNYFDIDSNVQATRAYILDASGNTLMNVSITSNRATFNYMLNRSTNYRLMVDRTLGTYNRTGNIIVNGPINGTNIIWTQGYVGASADPQALYAITSVTTTAKVLTFGINDTGNLSLVAPFNYIINNTNASNTSTSGICTTSTCNYYGYPGTVNITFFNISGGSYQNVSILNINFANSTNQYTTSYENNITLRLIDNVTGLGINSFSVNISNGTKNITVNTLNGVLSVYSLLGNQTMTYWNISGETYIPVTQNINNPSVNLNITNFTSQLLINISVYQLYTNNSINTFNITNNKSSRTTTTTSLLIPGNNGTNNIQIAVPGNYSKNITCTITTLLSTGFCNATDIYDDLFTIGASYVSGGNINNFTVIMSNNSFSSTPLNITTTNGSIIFPLLQGYSYLFQMQAPGYAFSNKTLPANASTNLYNFSLYFTNTLNISFVYENNNTIINNTQITLYLISENFSANYTTSNGTLYLTLLSPTTYTLNYFATGYSNRLYSFSVINNTYNELSLPMLQSNLATNFSVFITDKDSIPLNNYMVKILRYDINTNSFVLNQAFRTNNEGQVVFSVILNTQLYKFIIEDSTGVVLTTNPTYIYGTSTTLTINLNDFDTETYFNNQNIIGAITYNNITRTASFIYTDGDNIASQGCLLTYRTTNFSRILYNSSCVNSPAGTLTSIIPSLNNTNWLFKGTVYKSGNNYTIDTLSLYTNNAPNSERTSRIALIIMIFITLMMGIILKDDLRLMLIIAGSIPFWFMVTDFVLINPVVGFLFWVVCVIFGVVVSL